MTDRTHIFKFNSKEYSLICNALIVSERACLNIVNDENRISAKRTSAQETALRLKALRIKMAEDMYS